MARQRLNIPPAQRDMSWRLESACRNANPDLFTAPDRERSAQRRNRIEEAKLICTTCPVVASCLEWAMDQPGLERGAVLGNTTYQQRVETARMHTAAAQQASA